jgi:hypothetical protein
MPVNYDRVSRRFQPGGDIFNAVAAVATELHAEESRANPVDTGRSRSGWRIRYDTRQYRTTFYVYNNVRYVAFIRRRGTNERRGAFICEAASRVFARAGIRYTCNL